MTIKKAVKKKTRSKTKTKVRSNPVWWDKVLGKKRTSIEPGAYPFEVTDGIIILRGDKAASSLSELDTVFASSLKNLKIEFEPYNSGGKRYTLNKVKTRETELEDGEMTAEDRYNAMRRKNLKFRGPTK